MDFEDEKAEVCTDLSGLPAPTDPEAGASTSVA